MLDAATAVVGDTPAVRASIDRRGQGAALQGAPLDAQLAARVQLLRERFEFGVRIGKGFELGAEVHARSQKDAEKLAASLESLKAMMNDGERAGPKINVQVKDGTVKISLAISEEELKKAMAAQQGVRTPMGGAPAWW